MLARPKLSDEQTDWAREFFLNCRDPVRFAALADRSFSSPFVMRHSRRIGLEYAAGGLFKRMSHSAVVLAGQNLLLVAEQSAFHQQCVLPVTERYVYLKGPAAAQEYYRDLGLRISRDIDIIVHREDYEPLLRRAWSLGFMPLLSPAKDLEISDERDFQALLKYSTNHIVLRTPWGKRVEVHVEVDSKVRIPASAFLDGRNRVRIDTQDYSIPSINCFFTYLCLHHTRHYFSRAQWVADLAAVSTNPDFSRFDAERFAEAHGLGDIVASCLSFSDYCERPWLWINENPEGEAGSLLNYCVEVFGVFPSLERQLSRARHERRAAFSWETTNGIIENVVLKLLRRPFSLRDEKYALLRYYIRCPLPSYVQFLYVFPRIVDGIKRNLHSDRNEH
ncbi:MAG: nucleotidyltransferase family protein [Pseudomonadota bacterium]